MPTTQFKPGHIGHVTTALYQDKNIGIDGKIYQIIDVRVDRVKQDNPQLGDEVEYKISTSKELTEKGKISFFAVKSRAGAAPVAPAAAPAEPLSNPPVVQKAPPRIINVLYKSKAGTVLTVTDEMGQDCTYRGELEVLQLIAKGEKVKPGDWVSLELVQTSNEWVAMKIGPGTKPDSFNTGKQLLQQNIDAMKQPQKETMTELDIAKLKAESEATIKAQGAPKTVATPVPTKEPDKVPQNADNAVPDVVLHSPILAGTEIMGAVSLKIHINLGSFCNFDLGVEGATGQHARQLLAQEAEKSIPLVANIMKEAMKVSQNVRY